jgi:hypothetical protein
MYPCESVVEHQAQDGVLGPGVLMAGIGVGCAVVLRGLEARMQRSGGIGLAHHGGGLRDGGELGKGGPREAEALHRPGMVTRADSDVRFLGVGGQRGANVGDGGSVAVGAGFGGIVGRVGKAGSQRGDDMPATGQEEGEVFPLGRRVRRPWYENIPVMVYDGNS